MINKELLRKMLAEEYVMVQKHPNAELYIYNYTRKAQFENLWNEITLNTRGLILDANMDIVARPFIKFFNYEQLKPEDIPNLPFEAYEKMDGSLGILYWLNDAPFIASRGSFASDQAIHANQTLYTKYQHTFDLLDKSATYLFEIIYRENRIVCDYGDMDDLVLLAVIDNKTGRDLPLEDIGFPVVKMYDGVTDFNILRNDNDMQREGYIIKFSNDFRLKLKYAEYCRLHSIVTGVSTLTIWENLMNGQSMDELIDRTPDEFDAFIRNTVNDLNNAYAQIETSHKDFIANNEILSSSTSTRKEQAEFILSQDLKSMSLNSKILFNMLDGKSNSHVIWRLIRPEWTRPFAINDEDN